MGKREERLLRALGDVGSDLIDRAERKQFSGVHRHQWLEAAACLAVLLGLGLLAAPLMKPAPSPPQVQEEPAPEIAPVPEAEEEAARPLVPRERLTVLDTIYYVEGLYAPEQAEPLLEESMGLVQQADRPELLDRRAFPKKGCTWKNELPMEIFVSCDEGYLYCLTYFAGAKPLHQALPPEQWPARLEGLALPDLTFGSPAELDADRLLELFTLTLSLEEAAGLRSRDLNRYLWYDQERDILAVPLADVERQLSRYLEGYALHPEDSEAYDKALEAFILPAGPVAPVTADRVEVTYLDNPDRILLTLQAEERTVEILLNPTDTRTLICELAEVLP